MKNGNFFTIYFCCNYTCFLGVMSFSPEIIGRRVSEQGFLSKVDELECVSVYVCNINTIICFKLLIFTGRSNFSQCGLEPTGPDRNIRVVSGGWLHLDKGWPYLDWWWAFACSLPCILRNIGYGNWLAFAMIFQWPVHILQKYQSASLQLASSGSH